MANSRATIHFGQKMMLVVAVITVSMRSDLATAQCGQHRLLTQFGDATQFVATLLNGFTDAGVICAADLNRDGLANGADVQAFVECALSDAPCLLRMEGETAIGPGTNIPRSYASNLVARHQWGPSASLTWSFEGPQSGSAQYRVIIRHSNGSLLQGPFEQVTVLLDDEPIGSFTAGSSGLGSDAWNNFLLSPDLPLFTVSPGTHSLALSVTNFDQYGFEVDCVDLERTEFPELAISIAALPPAIERVRYGPLVITPSGGSGPPYTVSVSGLPSGLTFNTSSRSISGIPDPTTADSTSLVTVIVTDGSSESKVWSLELPVRNLYRGLQEATLAYFTRPEAIGAGGWPLSALKPTDRSRFGYTNTLEPGYRILGLILAYRVGLIDRVTATSEIAQIIETIRAVQLDASQSYHGLLYPFYTVVDSNGVNLGHPLRTPETGIPILDNLLLFGVLDIARGWAIFEGETNLGSDVAQAQEGMNFRSAGAVVVDGQKVWIPLTVDAITGATAGRAAVFGDEGGMAAWELYAAGDITLSELQAILRYQLRMSCTAHEITSRDALFFNMSFTLIQRVILGFPTTTSNLGPNAYLTETFLPNVEAHRLLASQLGMARSGIDDIMTQQANGQLLSGIWYVAPNQAANLETSIRPMHQATSAPFFPFAEYIALPPATRTAVENEIVGLANDLANYLHTPDRSSTPFGFEVSISTLADDLSYMGPDDGRGIFECLGAIYRAVPLYSAFVGQFGGRTMADDLRTVPGREAQIADVLSVFYPTRSAATAILENFDAQTIIGTWWTGNPSTYVMDYPQGLGHAESSCLRVQYDKNQGPALSTFAAQPIQDGSLNDFRPYSRLQFWVRGITPLRLRIDGEVVAGGRINWTVDIPANTTTDWEEKIVIFGEFGSLVDNIFFTVAPQSTTATGIVRFDDFRLINP